MRYWLALKGGSDPSSGLEDPALLTAAFGVEKLALPEDPLGPYLTHGAIEWVLRAPKHRPPENASVQDLEAAFTPRPEHSPLVLAWKHSLGDWVIPYDVAERKRKFARAYEELRDYIAAWEKLK
jgi:hypothetical protein